MCGNHNDLFNIKKYFAELTDSLYQSGISVDGLFLSFDAGFDAESLRSKTLGSGLTAAIAHNKRNSDTDNDHYFDHQLYKGRYVHGLTVSGRYSIDLIPH